MTNHEILRKAILKAIKNGWVLPVSIASILESENIEVSSNDVIFNHDFAKALWGETVVSFVPRKFRGAKDLIYPKEVFKLPEYKYRLQQMVIADDPIKYLGDHL